MGDLRTIRRGTAALFLGAVLALAGRAPAALSAQDPPPKPGRPAPTDPKAQEREKRAQDLWDAAEKFEQAGKFPEAQIKLRELRSRYRGTILYFDKMIEISDKINELGLKVAVSQLQKTTMYKRPHQDSWYSFEFIPPEGWKGVPPAAAWFGDYDNSEIDYKGQTIRVARYTSPYLDKLYIQVFKTYSCTSLDFLEARVTGELEQRMGKLKEEAKSTFNAARSTCARKIYTTDQGDRLAAYYFFDGKRGLAMIGTWRAGSEDSMFIRIISTGTGGTTMTTKKSKEVSISQEDFGYALKIFDQSAKSFWIYDPGTRQGMAIKLDKGALCSDWQMLRSSKGSYLIEYATAPEYAKRCGEELEQILSLYKQVLPTQKGIPQCRVKVFDREEDFMYYGQMPGAAAYWSPGQEEIVCYKYEGDKVKLDSGEDFEIADDKSPEEVTFKILYHEGFHQYMFYSMGRGRRIYVPSWLNEGLGDYFFGGDWNKGHSKFSIGLNDWRVATIWKAVKDNKHVALDRIIRYEQMQYYKDARLCYAQGWAMNYFFQQSPVAKQKGYHQIPAKMLEALKGGGDWEKATDKAFAGVDLKKMEEEWKAFVLGIQVPKALMDRINAMDENK